MNKIIFILITIVILSSGIYFYNIKTNSDSTTTSINSSNKNLISPSRIAEINGYILSIQGNEITIANEIGIKEITNEERARRQKLTQEERQALKAQESANLTKENVNLIIPVGIQIVKGSGDASGNNVAATMSEIVKGGYISIWKNGDEVEFVKLKGISTQ